MIEQPKLPQTPPEIPDPQIVRVPDLNDDRRLKIAADKDNVFSCYQQIISFEIVRLRGLLDRKDLPSAQHDPLTASLDNAREISLSAQQAPPESRVKALSIIFPIISQISGQVTGKKPQDGPDPKGNPQLIAALKLIREVIVPAVANKSSKPVQDMLVRSFGARSAETARNAFPLIMASLEHLWKQTGAAGAGFVFEPNLATGMSALASGDGKYIKVSRDALTGQRPTAELAADLLHEGSHTIVSEALSKQSGGAIRTPVDFAYINRDAHYYLTENLTVVNAANYEQVAREILGLSPGLADAVAAGLHNRHAPPLTLAHILLSSQVTRAWVRASDLATRAPQRAVQGNVDLRASLPDDRGLQDAWFAGLFEATAELMGVVQKRLTLSSSSTIDTDARIATANLGAMEITFAKNRVDGFSPEQLATLCLVYILRTKFGEPPEIPASLGDRFLRGVGNMFQENEPVAVPPGGVPPAQFVYDLVTGIQRLDRLELRSALAAYYASPEFRNPQG